MIINLVDYCRHAIMHNLKIAPYFQRRCLIYLNVESSRSGSLNYTASVVILYIEMTSSSQSERHKCTEAQRCHIRTKKYLYLPLSSGGSWVGVNGV